MRHRQNAAVVILVLASQFAIDMVPRTTISNAIWTAALDHEIWYNPVKQNAVVKFSFHQAKKIIPVQWS